MFLRFLLASLFTAECVTLADAAEPPTAAKSGELLFFDDFDRTALGDAWRVTWPAFTIDDGVLKAAQTKEHSAVGMLKVGRKDMIIEFRFRLDGASGINAVCNDRDFKDGHGGHICRVSLSPGKIFLADDKERLRHDIEEIKKDPKRKAEVAKHVEGRTASARGELKTEQWHRLRMEIVGDELRVALDGKPVGFLKSTGIGHPMKSDFYFAVSGKDARFDDLRIWAVESK